MSDLWRLYFGSMPGKPKTTFFLQRNPSFGETMEEVHISCRRSRWKMTEYGVQCTSVVANCVRLRTFWTTSIHIQCSQLTAESFWVYAVMFCCQGIILPGIVMTCELLATNYRTFAGAMVGAFWSVAMCFYPLLAYLVPNWVHLQLIISLFGLLSIPLYWYMKTTHYRA